MAFGITQNDALITLVPPLIVLLVGYRLVLENAGAITRRAAYMRVFLEIGSDSPKYETRLRKYREMRPIEGGRKLHGDVIYWLFMLSEWAVIDLSAIRFQSSIQRIMIFYQVHLFG